MSKGKLRLGMIVELKQGDLLEALQRRGWNQRQGAEFLGMSQQNFGKLINLQRVPKEFSPELTVKLFELTGKMPEELFPEWARTRDFLDTPKIKTLLANVTPALLGERRLLQLSPSPDEALSQRELERILDRALRGLTPREQQVIELRVIEEKSVTQVAREFQVRKSTVRQTERRALKKLNRSRRKLESFV